MFFSALGPQVYCVTVLKFKGRLAGCSFVLFPTLLDWFVLYSFILTKCVLPCIMGQNLSKKYLTNMSYWIWFYQNLYCIAGFTWEKKMCNNANS